MLSKKHDTALGGEFDEADAFGLNEFGASAGVDPMWGAVAGTGLGTVGAIATRQFTNWGKWSEAVGWGLGTAAGAAMIVMGPGTRAAGWTAVASSFLNNGLRQLEYMFFMPKLAAPMMGDVVIEPTEAFLGNYDQQMGIATIEPSQALLGLGQYQADPSHPELVGATLQQASDHVQLVGGPALAQHSSHWGATHFSGR